MKKLVGICSLALAACGEAGIGGSSVTLDPSGYPTAARFLSCLEGRAAVVSAHRGGPAAGFPENAIETFENTLAQVPALIETDVRETADGVLVLLHDETVDRTTNGTGRVAEMTLAEVKDLYLKDNDGQLTSFRVPTLGEALEAMRGRTVLQLDVKRGIGLAKVAETVALVGAQSHAAVITYTDNGAVAVAQAAPEVSVVASIDDTGDVEALEGRGLEQDRLIAWAGVIDTPDSLLYDRLGEADISTSGGALGRIDREAASGAMGAYTRLEAAGLDIIATDRPVQAAREIGVDDVAAALEVCSVLGR